MDNKRNVNGAKITKGQCFHAKARSECLECGGTDTCPHDRVRHTCQQCNAPAFCPHARLKHVCVVCPRPKGPPSPRPKRPRCEHDMAPTKCSICKRCAHGRIQFMCPDCDGAGVCCHRRPRTTCKDCKGGSVCQHERIRSTCRECKGGSVCQHSRIRSRCKECKGTSVCEHGEIRWICRVCSPWNFCDLHGRRRSACKDVRCKSKSLPLSGADDSADDAPRVGEGILPSTIECSQCHTQRPVEEILTDSDARSICQHCMADLLPPFHFEQRPITGPL
jgi:hypothetical protein